MQLIKTAFDFASKNLPLFPVNVIISGKFEAIFLRIALIREKLKSCRLSEKFDKNLDTLQDVIFANYVKSYLGLKCSV